MYTAAILAALIASTSAAPTGLVARQFNQGTYVSYNGDGTTGQGWPSSDQWKSFDDMWSANSDLMTNSCSWMGVDNTSPSEQSDLKNAIQSIGSSSGVDPRVILAMVMQESKGCVRIYGTLSPGDGVYNPGLLQDHAGKHTCNDGVSTNGNVQNPCPTDEINGMIADGVTGTGAGVSLKELGGDTTDSSKIYLMARKYNSGPNFAGGDLATGGATPAYASDIANRLMGVVFDKSSFVQGAAGSGPASSPASAPAAASSPAPASNGQTGGKQCHTVVAGDTCWSIAGKAIDGVNCAALQVGQQVCW